MRTVKFNLKAALKNPDRVVYRNGEKPKEWHFFSTAKKDPEPISSVSEGGIRSHNIDGYYFDKEEPYGYDLLLLSEPKVKK
jgi:hypothetical protein